MATQLPQIPLDTPILISPPGGYVDLSFRGEDGTALRIEDLSGQAQTVQFRCFREPPDQPGVLTEASENNTLFVGPLPIAFIFIPNPLEILGQGRLYIVFGSYTRPRVIKVTIA